MHTSRFAVLLSALLFCGVAGFAGAQELEDDRAFRELMQKEFEELSLKNPQDGDIIDLVDTILIVRLSRTLELTDQQTMLLARRVGDFKDQLHRLKWVRGDKRSELRDAVERAAPEEEIEKRLHELLKIEQTIADLIHDMIMESEKDLTIDQAARFYLFIGDFEDEITRLIQRAETVTRERRDAQSASATKE